MQVKFLPNAKKDLNFLVKSGNKKLIEKITILIENILQTPYQGIGKPEALKHELSGLWSRRINQEHRLI